MQIQENVLLAPYTTFKIGGAARYFCSVKNQQEALEAFEFAKEKNLPVLLLGGGSNILVSDNGFNGLVVKVDNKGIEVIDNHHIKDNNLNPSFAKASAGKPALSSKGEGGVLLKVASGEVWDEVVSFAVKNNWWGIENLSRIPGSTGAIAVQNVGAYGQEAKNVIESVTVFNKDTHEIQNLKTANCGFGYRSSIFNTSARGKYVIFYITFRLSNIAKPILTYRDLQKRFDLSLNPSPFEGRGRGEVAEKPSLAQIRQAIIAIRDKKFPFPTEAKKGNAGSFFKNPILTQAGYQELKEMILKKFGERKSAELEKKKFVGGGKFKVPAAFLIELCGLKNMELGGAAINHNQPLVIVNHSGKATARDVLALAHQVRQTVLEKTGVKLDFEPELIGF